MRANFLRPNLLSVGLTAFVLLGGFCGAAHTQTHSDSISEQHITIAGTLKRVETGLHGVTLTGDDGKDYPLDISHAQITLPSGRSALMPGMRAVVSGRLNLGGSITAGRLQAFPAALPIPPAAPPIAAAGGEPLDLTVRGTVEVVDLERGSFVLRVSAHTRIVFVTEDTDTSGLGLVAAGRFPVQPGQRVTVGGALQPNGTVLAGLLTAKENVNYLTAAGRPNRVLIGAVSSAPNKLFSRDFKVRTADGGGIETKIQVPHGIPIRRMGRSISVYDLSRRDTVRITGRINDSEFQAARIDVLAPSPDAALGSEPPTRSARPGL